MLLIACNRIKPSETLIHRIESTDCHCSDARRCVRECGVSPLVWSGTTLPWRNFRILQTRAPRFAALRIGMLAGSWCVQFKASEKTCDSAFHSALACCFQLS